MTRSIYFAPYQVPLVDLRTGIVSREWLLLFQAMFQRLGGASAATNEDLEQFGIEDFDSAAIDTPALLEAVRVAVLDAELNEVPPQAIADVLTLACAALDDAALGTVTSVGLASTDLSVSGSPITNAGSITANLVPQAGLIAGSYTYASINVNAKGIITAAGNGTAPVTVLGANPSASVGLAAVNGTATTYLRSDGAPALSQAIAPTWTGAHAFSLSIALGAGASIANAAVLAWKDSTAVSRTVMQMFSDNNVYLDSPVVNGTLSIRTNAASKTFLFGGTGTLSIPGALGVNGLSPPAQVTGFGTPTGPAVVTNFPGATATLVQCSTALAKLITDLKALGLYGT